MESSPDDSTSTALFDQMISLADDGKTNALFAQIGSLRHYLDIYRVLGLNAVEIRAHGGSIAFWGLTQQAAFDQSILLLFKIFEKEDKNHQRNSIPGVIKSFSSMPLKSRGGELERFGRKYGNKAAIVTVGSHLKCTLDAFRKRHPQELETLETYRHKLGAHSEHPVVPIPKPLYASLEKLYGFASDFQKVVAWGIYGTHVEFGTSGIVGSRDVLEKLGISHPRLFQTEKRKVN